MEVHHHSPHPHHRKRWNEYFYEFLMLFLAVTAGFFAENMREHVVERSREKEYIRSMVEDLKTDTAEIREVIQLNEQAIAGLDTFFDVLEHPALSDADVKTLYRLQPYAVFGYGVGFSQRTLAQLKNSGAMRLIQNASASDSINLYDWRIGQLTAIFKTVDEQTTYTMNASAEIFDTRYIRKNRFGVRVVSDTVQPHLLTTDPLTLRRFANDAYTVYTVEKIYMTVLKQQLDFAQRLIGLLQRDYNIRET